MARIMDERRRPLLIPLREAIIPIHKLTAKTVGIYVSLKGLAPGATAVKYVKHANVKKHLSKLAEPPIGGEKAPIGLIDTDTFTGKHSDIIPLQSASSTKYSSSGAGVDPANFVPVFDWDDKHVFVFVVPPNASTPEPPTAVPHKMIKTLAGILGWLQQKVKLVGKIDPYQYTGPDDIFPLDWQPQYGAPKFIPKTKDAIHAVFQPGGTTAADLTTTTVLQKKAPAALPTTDPTKWLEAEFDSIRQRLDDAGPLKDFLLQTKKDPNGLPWLKTMTGASWSLLPNDVPAKWHAEQGNYQPGVAGVGGMCHIDLHAPTLTPAEVEAMAEVPADEPLKVATKGLPADFELPAGHTITVVDKKAGIVHAVAPDGTKVKWVDKLDSWWDSSKPWIEYAPLKGQPIAKPSEAGSGEFKVTGTKDPHGYPKVQLKGSSEVYSLLPGDKAAVWDVEEQVYYPVKKYSDGWDVDFDVPLIEPSDITNPSILPPDFEMPKGFVFNSVGTFIDEPSQDHKKVKMVVYATSPDGTPVIWREDGGWYPANEPWGSIDVESVGPLPGTPPMPLKEIPKPAPKPLKYTAPSNAPAAPKGFEIGGSPNDNGLWPLTTEEYQDSEDWFIAPDGKLYKYSHYKGGYNKWKSTNEGWAKTELWVTGIAIQLSKYYPAAGPKVPSGFVLKETGKHGLPMIWKGAGTDEQALFPNGVKAKWSSEKGAYKTEAGILITVGMLKEGEFGPDAAEVEEAVVEKHPEPAPHKIKFTGHVDQNGFPLVHEDVDMEYAETSLTLLPDDRVARWVSMHGYYRIYGYTSLFGYTASLETANVTLGQAQSLMESLGLVVKEGRYHKVLKPETGGAAVLPGFITLTPNQFEKGLVPVQHEASGKNFYLLPNSMVAGAVSPAQPVFNVQVVSDSGMKPTKYKGLSVGQVRMMTKGIDPSLPEGVESISKVDYHGFPMVRDAETGEKLTWLPSGEVARWEHDIKRYLVWDWDQYFDEYQPSHPTKYVTLKEASTMLGNPLPGSPAPVSAVKSPKPKIAAPEIAQTVAPDFMKPTNTKDVNGWPIYEHVASKLLFTELPTSPKWGRWLEDRGAYRIYDWSDANLTYIPFYQEQHRVWLLPGSADLFVGYVRKDGTLVPVRKAPSAELALTGSNDLNGYPLVTNDAPASIKGPYSQLPDGKVGKWSDANGVYLLLSYDEDSGGYSMDQKDWTPPGKHSSQANFYIPGMEDERLGASMDHSGKVAHLLPDGRYGVYDHVKERWAVQRVDVGDGRRFKPTDETISLTDVKDQLKASLGHLMLRPVGRMDENNLHVFRPVNTFAMLFESDLPDATIVLLPSGKFAVRLKNSAKGEYREIQLQDALTFKTIVTWDEFTAAKEPDWTQVGGDYHMAADIDALYGFGSSPEFEMFKPAGALHTDKIGLPIYALKPEYTGAVSSHLLKSTYVLLPNGKFARWEPKEHGGTYREFELQDRGKPNRPIITTVSELEASTKPYLSGTPAPYHTPAEVKAMPGAPKEEVEVVAPPPPPVVVVQGQKKSLSVKALSAAPLDIQQGLPHPSALTLLGSGDQLGGEFQGDIYQGSDGNRFLFKPSVDPETKQPVPSSARAQQAFSELAKMVMGSHVPITVTKLGGRLGTLQPLLDTKKGTIQQAGLKPLDLDDVQKYDVAVDHMMNWMMGQFDAHKAHMIITDDGHIVSVNKEQGFRYFEESELSATFHPNKQFGETRPPFSNEFWQAFISGEMDFDARLLEKAINAIDHIPSKVYADMLRPFAEASFPGNPHKQNKFVEKILRRKLRVRGDFENFLTKVHAQREQKQAGSDAPPLGTFDFSNGWMTLEEKEGVKYKTEVISASDALKSQFDAHVEHYKDPVTFEPRPSEDRLFLKVDKESSPSTVYAFLKSVGVEPVPVFEDEIDPRVSTGPTHHIITVPKKAFFEASISKQVPISAEFTKSPTRPKHWPEFDDPPLARSNVSDMKGLHKQKIGREGYRITMDGLAVEGHTCKVTRNEDAKGEEYYFVTFKLRPEALKQVLVSDKVTSGGFIFTRAEFDHIKDKFDHSQTQTWKIGKGRKWKKSNVDCFVGSDEIDHVPGAYHFGLSSPQRTFVGVCYMKVREAKTGTAVLKKVREALNHVVDGLGSECFREVKAVDREVMRLSRLLWAVSPQEADKLSDSDRTSTSLTALLKDASVSQADIRNVTEQEVTKGYMGHVLPGRWRKMHDLGFRYIWNGISDTAAAVSILQSGLMSIHDRSAAGLAKAGASFADDVVGGSGDGSICRIVTDSAFSSGYGFSGTGSGSYQAIIHPEVLDRLDPYLYKGDKYGASSGSAWENRRPVHKNIKSLNEGYFASAEISFRRGIHRSKLVRMRATSDMYRKSLITAVHEKGISQVNGVPVEDFIILADSLSAVYDKYVKPLLGV